MTLLAETRRGKAFSQPSPVFCLIKLLVFLYDSRVTGYTSNTAGKAVIRKHLWQTPGCSSSVTTVCDDCYLRLRVVVVEVDCEGVGSGAGLSCLRQLQVHLWIKYLRITGNLLMQHLQTTCKKKKEKERDLRLIPCLCLTFSIWAQRKDRKDPDNYITAHIFGLVLLIIEIWCYHVKFCQTGMSNKVIL